MSSIRRSSLISIAFGYSRSLVLPFIPKDAAQQRLECAIEPIPHLKNFGTATPPRPAQASHHRNMILGGADTTWFVSADTESLAPPILRLGRDPYARRTTRQSQTRRLAASRRLDPRLWNRKN
jgi:hypothetical protein